MRTYKWAWYLVITRCFLRYMLPTHIYDIIIRYFGCITSTSSTDMLKWTIFKKKKKKKKKISFPLELASLISKYKLDFMFYGSHLRVITNDKLKSFFLGTLQYFVLWKICHPHILTVMPIVFEYKLSFISLRKLNCYFVL